MRSAAGVLDRQRGAAINIIIQRVTIAATTNRSFARWRRRGGMAAAYLAGTPVVPGAMLILVTIIGASPHLRNHGRTPKLP